MCEDSEGGREGGKFVSHTFGRGSCGGGGARARDLGFVLVSESAAVRTVHRHFLCFFCFFFSLCPKEGGRWGSCGSPGEVPGKSSCVGCMRGHVGRPCRQSGAGGLDFTGLNAGESKVVKCGAGEVKQ